MPATGLRKIRRTMLIWRVSSASREVTCRATLGHPYPGIEPPVGDIDQKVDDDGRRSEIEGYALDDGEIVLLGRRHGQAAEAWQHESRLDKDARAQGGDGDQAQHRDERNTRVAQGVLPDDRPLWYPGCSQAADERLPEDCPHAVPGLFRHHRDC